MIENTQAVYHCPYALRSRGCRHVLPATANPAFSSHCSRLASRGLALSCLLLQLACGGDDIDHQDELGASGADDYEIVVVEIEDSPDDKVAPGELIADDRAAPTQDSLGTASPASAIQFDSEGDYTVQVGIYAKARLATARVRELDGLGYPAYAIPKSGGGGVRVRIGYFTTREEARRFGEIFKEDTGAEFWIDRRANEVF